MQEAWPELVVLIVRAAAGLSTWGIWRGDVATWFTLAVWPATLTLSAYVAPVVFTRYSRGAAAALGPHRNLTVAIASAVGGMVFVALAVLVATLDTAAWQALATTDEIVAVLVAPAFTWSVTLCTVAWVFLGCLVHAFAPWDPLRETAAVVTLSAAGLLPVALPTVGYQVLRLADVNIAAGG